MKSNKILAMLVAFLCSATVSAQWTSHISLDKCTYSAIASEGQIAGNSMGFVMHYTDGSVVKFCKGNHLTDVGISTIATNDNTVYVGYSNGNIDIVDLSKLTTTNIPELKIHTSIENRAINQIYKYGQMIYCSTSCGVIVVNLNKNEISSRYLITTPNSPTINCLTICNDTIYVGTTNGLYYASVKNNILEDISEWTRHSTLTKNISDIANFDNNIFVAMGSKGSANKIYRTNTNNATLQWEVSSYRNMSATSNALMMVATNQITTYDKNLNQTETLSSLQISEDEEATDLSVYNAQLSENGTIAMATSQHGLVVATADGYADSYTITGPIDNYSFSLAATSKGIYCSKGGVNLQYNNLSRDIGISFYHDNEWTNSKDGQRDALIFAADPNCEDSVYMTTWGKGIYKIEDGKLSTHYTAENSLLTDIFGGSNYTRTFAIAYNKRSTLFVAQAQADNGIIVKSPDGEWGGLSYPIFYDKANPDYMFYNCIIAALPSYNAQTTTAFVNCIINFNTYGSGLSYNMNYYNCIFRNSNTATADSYLARLSNTTTSNNCVATGSNYGVLFSSLLSGANNKYVAPSALFEQNNVLTETAKQEYLGLDGTEVGIYGGNYPYDSKVQYPIITQFSSDVQTSKEGILNINVEVDGQ